LSHIGFLSSRLDNIPKKEARVKKFLNYLNSIKIVPKKFASNSRMS
jgi:hypothetical protein